MKFLCSKVGNFSWYGGKKKLSLGKLVWEFFIKQATTSLKIYF